MSHHNKSLRKHRQRNDTIYVITGFIIAVVIVLAIVLAIVNQINYNDNKKICTDACDIQNILTPTNIPACINLCMNNDKHIF